MQRTLHGPQKYPGGSKTANKEYLAQTILVLAYIETQHPHHIGTWTLRVCKNMAQNL